MQGRVTAITGASAGIGAALAELLATRGESLALIARRRAQLDEVVERCHGRAIAIEADVTDRAQVAAAVAAATERFGHLDVWINNAGRGITRPPSELTDADIDDMMRVNVKSALYGIQEVLPHFKSRGKGHIVNISSMLGRVPMATFRSAYSGAKHFLNALTAMLRDELKQTHPDIVVSLVSPGVVRTEFGVAALHGGPDSRQLPMSQSAEEVALVIADVLDTRRTDVYTRTGFHDQVVSYYRANGEDA